MKYFWPFGTNFRHGGEAKGVSYLLLTQSCKKSEHGEAEEGKPVNAKCIRQHSGGEQQLISQNKQPKPKLNVCKSTLL